jgi:chemotaxis protein MotB
MGENMEQVLLGVAQVRNKSLLITLIVVVSLLFLGLPNAFGYVNGLEIHRDAYTVTELERIVGEYKAQANVLRDQINSVERELDWLSIKINRISEAGRTIPLQLKRSIASKKKRILTLKKDKGEVDRVLSKYKEALASKLPKQAQKKAQIKPAQKKASTPIKSVILPMTEKKVSREPKSSAVIVDKRTKIEEAIRKAGLEDWVSVSEADGGCAKVTNTLPILFSSGSAHLAKEYAEFLKKLSNFLKPYDVRVMVSGYADPDPIKTKRYPSNFELGASRAATIVHEMVKYGLKPGIFKIGSTGEYRFAAKQGTTKKSFQRQAEVTVVFNT